MLASENVKSLISEMKKPTYKISGVVKRSPHVFQRQTSESSCAEAAEADPLDAVVAVVDGAGVLSLEFDELDDGAPVSGLLTPFDAIVELDSVCGVDWLVLT
jgi:hypothetical protein